MDNRINRLDEKIDERINRLDMKIDEKMDEMKNGIDEMKVTQRMILKLLKKQVIANQESDEILSI